MLIDSYTYVLTLKKKAFNCMFIKMIVRKGKGIFFQKLLHKKAISLVQILSKFIKSYEKCNRYDNDRFLAGTFLHSLRSLCMQHTQYQHDEQTIVL